MAEISTYIKLDRNIKDWRWYKDHKTLSLFLHLVLSANFEDKAWRSETIKRGQLVTSIRHLSEETGLSIREVRTALTHLKATQEATQRSTAEYTVITILNYEKYQGATHKVASERHTNDKPTTNDRQQLKKLRNKENVSSSQIADALPDKQKIFDSESKPYKCAVYLAKRITERIPNKSIPERTIQLWAIDIDKINRLDGQEWQDITAVLDFSQQSTFWSSNILSGKKLREKFDQLFLKMQEAQ